MPDKLSNGGYNLCPGGAREDPGAVRAQHDRQGAATSRPGSQLKALPLPLLTNIDDHRPCDRPIQFRGLQATASGTFSADSTCRLSSSGTRWDVCSLSSSDTVGRLVTRSLVSGWLVCISAVPHNTLSFERRGAPSNRPMTG